MNELDDERDTGLGLPSPEQAKAADEYNVSQSGVKVNPAWVSAPREENFIFLKTTQAGTEVNVSVVLKGEDDGDYNRVQKQLIEFINSIK